MGRRVVAVAFTVLEAVPEAAATSGAATTTFTTAASRRPPRPPPRPPAVPVRRHCGRDGPLFAADGDEVLAVAFEVAGVGGRGRRHFAEAPEGVAAPELGAALEPALVAGQQVQDGPGLHAAQLKPACGTLNN